MTRRRKEQKKPTTLYEFAKTILSVVLLVILIRSTLVQAYHIPSGSMEDTLLEGDYVLGDKLTFGTQIPDRLPILNLKLPSFRMPGFWDPEPGDLVIFEFPEDSSKDFIKRCVAVGGQTIEVRNQQVFVNGEPFDDPPGVKYLQRSNLPRRFRRAAFGPKRVPERHIFVMGDNRDNSYDSRIWGPVSLEKIKAHPLVIYYSWDRDIPIWQIWRKVRWWRLGPIW